MDGLWCVIPDFANCGWFSERALMILVLPATNRREIEIFRTNSASCTTFLEWVGPQLVYVSRSTSRHSSIFIVFCHKIGQVGDEIWPDGPSQESPGLGVAMRRFPSARGFDFGPYRPIWSHGASVRGHLPIFRGIP